MQKGGPQKKRKYKKKMQLRPIYIRVFFRTMIVVVTATVTMQMTVTVTAELEKEGTRIL